MSPLTSLPVRIVKVVLSALLGAGVGIFLAYISSPESASVKFDLWLGLDRPWWIWGLIGAAVAVAIVQVFTLVGRRSAR
jgi:hypothetical protein